MDGWMGGGWVDGWMEPTEGNASMEGGMTAAVGQGE